MADQLVSEYYACFNERRIDDALMLFAPDSVMEAPPFTGTREGGHAYKQFTAVWWRAFPDARFRIEAMQQRGDSIREVDIVASGTHADVLDLGGYGTFKPSGGATTLRLRELIEVRGGKIAYSHVTFDAHELIRQLSSIDVATLIPHLDEIQRLRERLAERGIDPQTQRHLTDCLGRELDAARLIVRPWFRR